MYNSIIIAGPPSVGKGTQCDRLVKTGYFFHLSTGDEFRKLKEKTELSQLEKKIIETNVNGNYVPDELVMEYFVNVVDKYANEKKFDPINQTLLLDGIPRTESQRIAIEKNGNFNISSVVLLEASRELLLKRVEERKHLNREDDKNIIKRINIYFDKTRHIFESYGSKLIPIDTTPKPGMKDSKDYVQSIIFAELGLSEEEDDPIADIFAEASEMPASGRTFNGKVPRRYDLGINHQGQTRAVFKMPNPE